MISEDDVLQVLSILTSAGVDVTLDGGWGIDALIGEQTREHDDLDLVVDRRVLEPALEALAALGFTEREATPGRPARVVLRDERERQVDLHPVVFDARGNGWQPLPNGAWGFYPAEGLTGTGSVGGRHVACLTAELQLRHHLGYRWTEKDLHDVRLLHARFDISLPPEADA